MLKTESILTPEEIQLCLVIQYFIDELAVLVEQEELLQDESEQEHLLIILP